VELCVTAVQAATPNTTPWSVGRLGLWTDLSLGARVLYRWEQPMDSKKPRIFTTPFGSVYPLYVQKAEKKGRTQDEVDQIITWLTGYNAKQVQRAIDTKVDFETFFAKAPKMNTKAALITGVVCGVRVEDVTDPLMQKIRYLDKLIDELAKGKKVATILRK
jgi:hypothetical protein